MAKPITPSILEDKDFEVLLRDLEKPRKSSTATSMYEAGRTIHEELVRVKKSTNE